MRKYVIALFACLGCAAPLLAEDTETAQPDPTVVKAGPTLIEQLKETPDDRSLFMKYLTKSQREIQPLIGSDPEKAKQKIAEMKALVDSLEPEKEEGKQTVELARRMIESFEIQIEINRVTLPQVVEQLKENLEDTKTIALYRSKLMRDVMPQMRTDPDKAEEMLNEAEELVASLKPESKESKQYLSSIQQMITLYKQQIELGRMTLDELVEKLKENPDDAKLISMYGKKLGMEIRPIARTEPDKAEAMLNAAKQLLAGLGDDEETDDVKAAVKRLESSFKRLEDSIETGKKLAALVGAEAAPLEVEAWVNGEPITDDNLKGKVVLLDFWAVWCGPCVATFPHLREWHEKYADKGLEIIGLTRYYGYVWDDDADRQARPDGDEKPTPEEEQEMLAKFAKHHNLHHRLAIQTDRDLSEYYAVSGIPHVVVIDREGKVRLIRIGSGPKTAHDVTEMLEELLGEGQAGADNSSEG